MHGLASITQVNITQGDGTRHRPGDDVAVTESEHPWKAAGPHPRQSRRMSSATKSAASGDQADQTPRSRRSGSPTDDGPFRPTRYLRPSVAQSSGRPACDPWQSDRERDVSSQESSRNSRLNSTPDDAS